MVTKLRSNQTRAIESLLSGMSKGQAATIAGITPGTLSRWLSEPDFKAALTTASDEALRAAAASFTGSLEAAQKIMKEIAEDESEDSNTRLRAADLLANHSEKLRDAVFILERLEQLEEMVNVDKNTT